MGSWIDLFEAVRAAGDEQGLYRQWISLTCYVNPSPWFLQWANSLWLQCGPDQAGAGVSMQDKSDSQMDCQMNARDAAYHSYIKDHQFQFPLAHIYNHDPVYGKSGTAMTADTATAERFQNYLYTIAGRGTAFWELYFSDSILDAEKYEVAAEFLEWAEANFHMLRNAKMFGKSRLRELSSRQARLIRALQWRFGPMVLTTPMDTLVLTAMRHHYRP